VTHNLEHHSRIVITNLDESFTLNYDVHLRA
jgi:hypothetical protein